MFFSNSVMEHFEYSYIVYKAFLKYLYTDIVDLSLKELLGKLVLNTSEYILHMYLYSYICLQLKSYLSTELLDLAIAYCENKLEKYCILEIKRKTTVPNVAFIYSTTIKYNKKVTLCKSLLMLNIRFY